MSLGLARGRCETAVACKLLLYVHNDKGAISITAGCPLKRNIIYDILNGMVMKA